MLNIDTYSIYNAKARKYDAIYGHMESMFAKERKIFNKLKGNILEIGVGTGNNLPYYNEDASITALDLSPEMIKIATKKVKKWNLKNISQFVVNSAENLSDIFPKNHFDYVTSTCVFCSIPQPLKALKEVAKVLKPGGKLIQIEHGLTNIHLVNGILKLLDPIIAPKEGFHVNRNHVENIKQTAGFKILKVRNSVKFGFLKLIISKKI